MRLVNFSLPFLRRLTAQQRLLLKLHPDGLAETWVPTKFGGNDHPRHAESVFSGRMALRDKLLCIGIRRKVLVIREISFLTCVGKVLRNLVRRQTKIL